MLPRPEKHSFDYKGHEIRVFEFSGQYFVRVQDVKPLEGCTIIENEDEAPTAVFE